MALGSVGVSWYGNRSLLYDAGMRKDFWGGLCGLKAISLACGCLQEKLSSASLRCRMLIVMLSLVSASSDLLERVLAPNTLHVGRRKSDRIAARISQVSSIGRLAN